MNRRLLPLLLLLPLVVVWGCSIKPWIHVFNNSRDPIVVRVGEVQYVAEPSEAISFLYENDDLTVEVGEVQLAYRIAVVPPDFIRTGWFRGHMTFQVDPDRRVFVLKAHDRPPVDVGSYTQPEGFPLTPIRDGGRIG